MLSNLTMTIIAGDRPGLVQLVADRVAANGGNWLESRMCRLGGQFAGIVRVAVPSEQAAALSQALNALQDQGLRIQLQTEKSDVGQVQGGTLVKLDLVGHDRPGIVRQITSVLAAHSVNVEEFASECINSPMDGAQLFQARASVLVPPTVPVATLRAELEKLASDLMVDVQLGAK